MFEFNPTYLQNGGTTPKFGIFKNLQGSAISSERLPFLALEITSWRRFENAR